MLRSFAERILSRLISRRVPHVPTAGLVLNPPEESFYLFIPMGPGKTMRNAPRLKDMARELGLRYKFCSGLCCRIRSYGLLQVINEIDHSSWAS